MSTLSSEDYAGLGSRCPVCGSENIEWVSPPEPNDSSSLSQETVCKDCQAGWYEIYKLVGYSGLEE